MSEIRSKDLTCPECATALVPEDDGWLVCPVCSVAYDEGSLEWVSE